MPKTIPFEKIISRLRDYHQKNRRLPSFGEMQTLLGYRSKSAVSHLIDRLCEKQILRKDGRGKLVPLAALAGGAKLLGYVQAGFPSPAEEELIDTLSLDEFLIQKPEATYLVKVSGDSMIDAGIHPNDLVLVERGKNAKPGDIVIAQVDGEWTMKYYLKQGGRILLRAANARFADIHPSRELVIGGIVVACIRKYGK